MLTADMLTITARPTRQASPNVNTPSLRCLCTVTHGDDSCVVLGPDRAAVDRVMRDRRVRLGLAAPPQVTEHPMVLRCPQ